MPMNARGRTLTIAIATGLGILATGNLGAWQLRRAAQKMALQAEIDARARMPAVGTAELASAPAAVDLQRYRPTRLRGRWAPAHNVFLENRQTTAGRVGFYLLTPFLLEGRADAVVVQRGWVPRDLRDRTLLPPVATASGTVEIEGRIAPPPARLYEFASSTGGTIRQNLDLDRYAAETGLPLLPLSIQQSDSAATRGDGLVRDWPRPAVDVQRNHGYAFQWFAMAVLMAGLYVWFQWIRPWRERRHVRS
ncbi:MAG: SURF1 family protein [Pseudomonadota bacterium]|nr:SURF1 family protein [Pseudomonadota bacterium]